MSKTTDDFIDWLFTKKIRQYRIEMLTDFYDDPKLLLGDGLRSFEMLSLFVPVLNIGPNGYPIPPGVFVDSVGDRRFVATSFYGDDVLNIVDDRNSATQNHSRPTGGQVKGSSADENWHAFQLNTALVGGAIGPIDLVVARVGWQSEIDIYDIIVQPIDHVDPVFLLFEYTASGGNILGQIGDNYITYKFDVVNHRFAGAYTLHFTNGKRFIGDTFGESGEITVSGGKGGELLTILGNYRQF